MDLWTELPFLGKFALVGLLICACIIGWLLECRLRCAEGKCLSHTMTTREAVEFYRPPTGVTYFLSKANWDLIVKEVPNLEDFGYVSYEDPLEDHEDRLRFIERRGLE